METTHTLTNRLIIEINDGVSELRNTERPSKNKADLHGLAGNRCKDKYKRKKQIANQHKNIIPFMEKEMEREGEGRKGRREGRKEVKEGGKKRKLNVSLCTYISHKGIPRSPEG